MANFDILNPKRGYDATLGFNANWRYGSPRKVGANYQTFKPAFGPWVTRAIGDAGYSFDLTFVGPIAQVRYIKTFYERFQRGFFTLIDHDNAGRHHVGRFTSYADDTQTANLNYTAHVVFEEIPGCPMLEYPATWDRDSHWIYAVDDFLNASYMGSAATAVMQQTPASVAAGASVNDPSTYEMYEPAAVAGDFIQMEYIGWGFQMPLRIAANLGICTVMLDGAAVATNLDLSTGTCPALAAAVMLTAATDGPYATLQIPNVSLGRHRVKILASGTRNAAASDTGIIFPGLQVIH